jgi:hypothetical protein
VWGENMCGVLAALTELGIKNSGLVLIYFLLIIV